MTARRRLLLLALVLCALAVLVPGRRALAELDRRYLGEALRDLVGRARTDEDWAQSVVLSQPDYRWLGDETAPVRIAHALGGAGGPGANTLAMLEASIDAGFELFEVDLWLDSAGILRCHHGPEPPPPIAGHDSTAGAGAGGICTLPRVLARLRHQPRAWLVLDLKSRFEPTAQSVLETLRDPQDSERVIFQLYQPQQLVQFARWSVRYRLPGPIVTAYQSARSVEHLAMHSARAGVQVLTLALHRRVALRTPPAGLRVFLHPIADCAALTLAQHYAADGVYVPVALTCPPGP